MADIVIDADTDETIVAATADRWIVNDGVTIHTPGLAFDASAPVAGRAFIVKGTLHSDSGPAMRLGHSSLADSATSIRIDSSGSFLSGGAGLLARSGGVAFEVTGDRVNGTGLVETAGLSIDFRMGGNVVTNDGTIRSTAGTAIRSAGELDRVLSNGTIEASRDAIVSRGDGTEIVSNGVLRSTEGQAIRSTGDGLTFVNAGLVEAAGHAVSAAGADAGTTNDGTIRSTQAAGIVLSGPGATVVTGGLVKGDSHGILSTGDDATITNNGTVKAAGTGIEATGDGSTVVTSAHLKGKLALVIGGDETIATNLNVIRGTSKNDAAVSILGKGDADFTNEGSVFARSGLAVSAGGGQNSVVNTVSLHGDVRLGGGNDVFASLVGEVDGKVYGGRGSDVYETGILLDIVEKRNQGNDTVKAQFTWTLGANIENLELTGDARADATGNRLDNVLTGNAGDNRFWGHGGRDIFVLRTGGGIDAVMDFQDGRDLIDFRDVAGINGFSSLRAHMDQSGADVVIDLTDRRADMLLIIRRTDLDDLGAGDFLF